MIAMEKSRQRPAECVRLRDLDARLEGMIVIDSTVLGPGAGGCRLWRYASPDEASADAVRLARGMSYKNAMACLPFGGAKAAIVEPEGAYDREALLSAFARVVESLGGRYVTAADVGTTSADMDVIARTTRHVAGCSRSAGRAGGDPAPWTARGVFLAMRAAAQQALRSELAGKTVAVQGLGQVGAELCRLLADAGAELVVSDISKSRCEGVARELGARVANADDIVLHDADIFSPCALGGVLTRKSAAAMKARLVCGAANNQLADAEAAAVMMQRGIVYVPDYVANAGGIISAAAEYLGEREDEVGARVERIALRVAIVLEEATRTQRSPAEVADEIAETIIAGRRAPGLG